MKKASVNKVLVTAVMVGALTPGMATVAQAQTPEALQTASEVTVTTGVVNELKVSEFTYTEAQKTFIQAGIDLENNTRQLLIQTAKATGDWQGYKSFEAFLTPQSYNVVDGKYVENKNYYAEKLTETISGIQNAETEEIKASWEKVFQATLNDFRNAPSKNGVIPNVVGVNDTAELAEKYNVPRASNVQTHNEPGPISVETFNEPGPISVETFNEPGPISVETFNEPGPISVVVEEIEEKVFTPELKRYIQATIDLENNTRQSLIKASIASGDWNEYKSVEALFSPAWYSLTADGKYMENKVYYGNTLESNLRAIQQAETEEDKASWKETLEENLELFRNAHAPEGIIPYVIGINNNEANAKEYNVPVVSAEYFNSKFNSSTVSANGKFKNEEDNHIFKVDVIKTLELVKSVKFDSSKFFEVKPTEPIDLGVNAEDGFSEEEKALIQGQIDLKNNTRESLILEAISNGDWNKYYAFQAKENPAWYMVSADGEYVKNKFYYVNQLESKVRAMNMAENEELKSALDKVFQETLEDFRNAPTPDNIIPYVIGVNNNEGVANENNVEVVTNNYFDSKYNSPTVASEGKFKK